MAGVGSMNPTALLIAVERESEGSELLVEEVLIEQATHRIRLRSEFTGSRFILKPPRDGVSRSPRRIDIGLNLHQGDRSLGQRPILVKNGVMAVFPALVDEAVLVLPCILDEA